MSGALTKHVHALDINSDFVSRSRKNANAAGVGDRITAHQCDGSILPLPDESLDRLTTRNTIIYVDDPALTIREFRRVLRAGGKLHTIEGDWPMMVIEPVPSKDWVALVNAASHACRTPDIGRKLYGLMVRAGFSDIDVRVITRPDTDGRLMPMIKNMAAYAHGSDKIDHADVEKILSIIEQAISDRSYLALAPQFVVTATR
jgi:ubiquinone/menaquinone biosynthesis C-methylase UbiE